MRFAGDSAATTLGMTVFQKVRQLIAVLGMNGLLQTVGCFTYGFDRPAFAVSTGFLRCACLDFLFHRLTCSLHSFFHILGGKFGILIETLHNGICHLVDTNRTSHIKTSLSRI